MTNKDYRQYLASKQWADKRSLVMVRALGKCEIEGCPRKAREVHHKTYLHIFNEDVDDLLAICSVHHRQLHCPPSVMPVPWKVFRPKGNGGGVAEQLDLFAANDNGPVVANDNNEQVNAATRKTGT